MRENHIIKMIEGKSVDSLGEDELQLIEAHIAGCSTCLEFYEAARISDDLIRARAGEVIAPSPFFKTRVMAAIEKRNLSPELPAIVRMWKAAGALVSSLAVIVAILIGLTFYAPGADTKHSIAGQLASGDMYSVEYLELERTDAADDGASYDQVLGTIYDAEGGDEQ